MDNRSYTFFLRTFVLPEISGIWKTEKRQTVPRRGVTRLDGARGKKQVWRCSNLRSFGSKFAVEESAFDIVVTFRRLGNCPLVTPVILCKSFDIVRNVANTAPYVLLKPVMK